MIKRNEKFKYIEGKQLTDHGTGTRVYEVVGTKLPSVTTILGATKDQEFLKNWKAKVGEAKAEEIKNLSKIIKKITKYKGKIVFNKKYPDGVKDRKLDTSILDKMGWSSKVKIQNGLQEYYNYFIKKFKLCVLAGKSEITKEEKI